MRKAQGRRSYPVRASALLPVLFALQAGQVGSAEPEYVVQIKDHRFVPAEVRIPSGKKVRVIIDNQGDTPEEFDSHSLNREKHVPPHSRVTLFIGPLDVGRYIFEGENHGDGGGAALGVVVAE
jgi:hypothetical protein